MSSYSSFAAGNDDLDLLLVSSPALGAPQEQQGAVPPPLQLSPFTHEPLQSQQHGFRRRSNSTMTMLTGADGDELRCRYPSKLCRNTRVRKASGAFHRYCEHHREKANANQKRWVDRQRNEGGGDGSSPSSAVTSPSLNLAKTKYRWIIAARSKQNESNDDTDQDPATNSSVGAATLSDDDWDALLSFLAPPQSSQVASRSSASRCEHRRRAASSPMLPAFASKGNC